MIIQVAKWASDVGFSVRTLPAEKQQQNLFLSLWQQAPILSLLNLAIIKAATKTATPPIIETTMMMTFVLLSLQLLRVS